MKSKNKRIKSSLRKRLITLFLILLCVHVVLTAIISFFTFQKLLDSQMEGIDFKTTALKSQIEKYYDGVSEVHYDVYDLLSYDTNGGTDILKSHVEKTFPGMEFTINNIQGDIVYKDFPKLIYKNETKSYLFEIKRQISFKSNLPFKSIELSIRFNFLKIIFQSLLISSVLSAFLILPILVFYVNTTIKPLFALAKAASQIAKGKYGVKVNFNPKDEIGQVIKSFNYMSEELSKMKEIRDDLLATVSHELRSPLGRIRGYTELMLDIDLPEKDKKSFYESILSEIDLLNNMVGEILEVSRLEMKKERLFLEVFDMKYFFEMLAKELEVLEKAKNVDIEYSCIENLFCEIDVEKIKRVIVNIIQNAINARARNVYVSMKKIDDICEISIANNGRTLGEDYFQLVFEKFYRVDKARDRESGGFGLGLAICKGIIEEHKGRIFFTKVDDGTKLIIQLPLIEEEKS